MAEDQPVKVIDLRRVTEVRIPDALGGGGVPFTTPDMDQHGIPTPSAVPVISTSTCQAERPTAPTEPGEPSIVRRDR